MTEVVKGSGILLNTSLYKVEHKISNIQSKIQENPQLQTTIKQ